MYPFDCFAVGTRPSIGTPFIILLYTPGDGGSMARTLSSSVGIAVRDTVPFLVITAIWIVVMSATYGLFLLAKPAGVTYTAAIHASVFVPPLFGFLAHLVRELLRTA